MNIKNYIKNLKEKVKHYDKKAQNPFLEKNSHYNPFIGGFSQTYVWVEHKEDVD